MAQVPMDPEALRKWGKEMVDLVADYWTSIRDRRPMPDVKPGYMRQLIPAEPPLQGEPLEKIFADLENVVIQGTTHWHHPHFFAYYPAANSYAAIVGDILSSGLACVGFTWNSSPACTELEMVVMDWLAKALKLPDHFLNAHPGPGAGMIQCTASDCTLVALLAARSRFLKGGPGSSPVPADTATRLIAYCSDQAHCSVERAAMLGGVKMRKVTTGPELSLDGTLLEAAMAEDVAKGLIPFFVCATLGSTPTCSFDNLLSLGPVCGRHGVWLHVDAAYAGSAFICPEYRHYLDGVEMVDSFNFNPHKWLLVNFDCSAMWFKDTREVEEAFHVDPVYLKHDHQGVVPDYRHWQIPLGRRFRSLKLWFVIRSFGITGLQGIIRKMCALAKDFEALVKTDERFELVVPVALGLVCFRLKESNEANEKLLKAINEDRRIHLVPSAVGETFFLRLSISSTLTNQDDVKFAWGVIQELASSLV